MAGSASHATRRGSAIGGRVRRVALSAALIGGGLAAAPVVADAATAVSSNWAGYAVAARDSTKFRRVAATWVVPKGTCRRGTATFSAAWIGLGGLAASSQALEQTGTEFDCGSAGHSHYSAWYELLPAAPTTLRLTVRPGDTVRASVEARGSRISFFFADLTTGQRFARTRRMSSPDVSSAEWIVEAPSACDVGGNCIQLPLSNFGSLSFAKASATNAAGHSGTISDPAWQATQINLLSGASQLGFARAAAVGAFPSALSADGSAFSVTYREQAANRRQRRTFTRLRLPTD